MGSFSFRSYEGLAFGQKAWSFKFSAQTKTFYFIISGLIIRNGAHIWNNLDE